MPPKGAAAATGAEVRFLPPRVMPIVKATDLG